MPLKILCEGDFSEHMVIHCIDVQQFIFGTLSRPSQSIPNGSVSITTCEHVIPALQGLKSRMKVPRGWVVL